MGVVNVRLTVYFDDPFWIGVFERIEDSKLTVSKVTFGAEPKDHDVLEFVLKHYYDLKFSPAVETVVKSDNKNPKRRQREISRQMHRTGIGTKSQQALKMQQEENKLERKIKSREEKQLESKLRFEKKQQKKKEKHRGR